ncbi:MAG: hypothetical protein QG575_958, partial [Euryarchaeota archaeon]|nr:hypothetical protein [Euryarchaeota archaeon]
AVIENYQSSNQSYQDRYMLIDLDLSDQNLSAVHLNRSDMMRCILDGVDLRGAYLIGAEISSASLIKSNLTGANMEEICLHESDLFLLTHNFDAKPMGDYVELNLNEATYKLIPNGDKPGLCDISPAISLI